MAIIVEYLEGDDADEAFQAAQRARTQAIRGPAGGWSDREYQRLQSASTVPEPPTGFKSAGDQIYYPEATGQQVRRLPGEIEDVATVGDPETVRELFGGTSPDIVDAIKDLPPDTRRQFTGEANPRVDSIQDLQPDIRRLFTGEAGDPVESIEDLPPVVRRVFTGEEEPPLGPDPTEPEEEPEPREIVLPFSELNNITGIREVEDVIIEIPSVAQIQAAIADIVLDQRAIREALRDVLEVTDIGERIQNPDALFGPILGDAVDTIRGELLAVQDDIIETVEAVSITTDEVIESIQEDLDLPTVDDLPDLDPIQEDIDGILTAIEDLPDQIDETIDGIAEDVQIGLLEVLLDVEAGPDEEPDELIDRFLRDQGLDGDGPLVDQLIDLIADRLADRLVDEEARQNLQDAIDNF